MPVSEGLRIRYHRDLLSTASVLNILDQDTCRGLSPGRTILGILLVNREHRKTYSAVLFGSNSLSSLHLLGVRDQRVPDRKSVTELDLELFFKEFKSNAIAIK